MTTFDSTKRSLREILQDIVVGKIQIPDFQRGWVWDDDHVRDLIVSIARSFPIGSIMLLETGGEVNFKYRPVEGIEKVIGSDAEPEYLILDGQQRLTTLTQAIALETPVRTRTNKGKPILRHYYFDIEKSLENPFSLEEAVLATDENRQIRGNFGRDLILDLSTREKECLNLLFPCDQILDSDEWEMLLNDVNRDKFGLYMEFRKSIINSFRNYQIPIIMLKKETSREAVCLVFEKVNTGGVQLSVFELVTASYAADGYNLRDDWFGTDARQVQSRKERLEQHPLLRGTEAPEFLQAITLLHTHELRTEDIKAGKTGKQVRPISAKRADVLQLPLDAWKKYADKVEQGFIDAAKFLQMEAFPDRREVPYTTQIIPLAAVMAQIGDRWREPRIYEKLARWFWCGVLGELYGGAVETRIANDYEDLLQWFEDDAHEPRTVRDASFQPERLDTLRTRLSAAYKGINVLVVRSGARDWFWKASIKELDAQDIRLDIHHIFPRAWCEKNGIKREKYDNILNKTMISYKANRMIGGDAPSRYLRKLQQHDHVQLDDEEMDAIVETHALSAHLLRTDDFEAFVEDRRTRILHLVERVMGKAIVKIEELPAE